MPTSPSTNNCAQNFPNFGLAYAVNGQSEIQANSIDSGALTVATLQLTSVTLTAAQVVAMYATPVQLIAGITGKSIIIDYVMARYAYSGTAFTGGGAIDVQIGSTNHGGGTAVATTLPAAVLTTAASADTLLGATAANITLSQGTGIFASNATGPFAAGTGGTLTFFIYYTVL